MALISTMTIPEIQDLVKKSFQKSLYAKVGGDVRQIFIKDTMNWEQDIKRIFEIDRDRFAEGKTEGQSSAQRGISKGYFKDIQRYVVSITRVVSGEQYMALQAHKLAEYAMNVANDVVDKIELDMANFIGMGTAGVGYIDNGGYYRDTSVGDGNPVFFNAHTLKNTSTTYSNILTGNPQISDTSFQLAEDFFNYSVMDNNGQVIDSIQPNTIVTAKKAVMRNRVARIFNSTSSNSIEGSANANSGVVNVYKGKNWKHLEVRFDVNAKNIPDATKSFYWFVMALNGSPENSFQAYYISWLSPTVAPTEVDQDKWVLSMTARAALGLGAVSGKGAVVSLATS